MATDWKAEYEKLKAKYDALDAKGDTLLQRFIAWRGSTAVVVVVLLLAVVGAVYLTAVR